jgi:hypothetical protein
VRAEPDVRTDGATPLPIWLPGSWVRQGRSYDGAPRSECSDVAWFQVGPWFADLRIPRPGHEAVQAYDVAQAFSGTLDVSEVSDTSASVTWWHDLDTQDRPSADADTARVTAGDAVLVESGAGYVEWWRRPDGVETEAPGLVLERVGPTSDSAGMATSDGAEGDAGWNVTARVVRVGPEALAVWAEPEPGGALCTADGDWEPDRLIGLSAAPEDVSRALRSAIAGERLPDGWHEQRGR